MKRCINCNTELLTRSQIKFCSRKCAAIVNNKLKYSSKPMKICPICGDLIKNHSRIYCSMKCTGKAFNALAIKKYLSGKSTGYVGQSAQLSRPVREYIKTIRGSACIKCGWDEKHPVDFKSLTEINHIDGNAKNCDLLNLEILCPNCHSMTSNFRARNKKSTRIRNIKPKTEI